MHGSFAGFLAVTVTLLAAGDASARLMDASSPLPEERTEMAVHLPTGCMAKLSFEGAWLTGAQIVDRTCLPRGVTERAVPGSLHDFSIVRAR